GEGPWAFDLARGRRCRNRPGALHPRCRGEGRAHRDGEGDGGGRPRDERECDRDRVVEVTREIAERHLSTLRLAGPHGGGRGPPSARGTPPVGHRRVPRG